MDSSASVRLQGTEQAVSSSAGYPTQPILARPQTPGLSPSAVPQCLTSQTSSLAISSPSSSLTQAKKNANSENTSLSGVSQWITAWVTDWWGLELFCWTISAISLIAIVIVLESHKSKPLPEWPFRLTINSLVSIFATISQLSMLQPVYECISQLKWLWFARKERLADFQAFDGASRGPLGSLILLGRFRAKGLHLIMLGAAIAVSSIAFGSFAQQVVTYPLHSHPTGNASTPLVVNFTGASILTNAVLDGAVSNGLAAGYNETSLSEVTPSCPTGNCTWTEYTSLGICANVVDVSPMISKNPCNQTALDGFFIDVGLENPGYPCFNYTLPFVSSNTLITTDLSDESSISTNATLSNVVPLINQQTGHPFMQILTVTPMYRTSKFSIVDAYIIFQPGNLSASLTSPLAEPAAYAMNLGLCIQTLNTTVSSGRTNTSQISSQPVDLGMFEVIEGNGTSGTVLVSNNQTDVTAMEGGIKFQVGGDAITVLSNLLFNTFSDNCYNQLDPTILDQGGLCISLQSSFGTTLLGLEGANVSDANGFLTAGILADNIATSLTNALRAGTNTIGQGIQFQGTSFSDVPFVETEYLWFIFPITLVSLSLIFLISTILKSQRVGSRIWKSSNLATLQGLDIELHNALGGISSISEMDERAKLVSVRFDMKVGRAENGVEYRLVEVKQEDYWKG